MGNAIVKSDCVNLEGQEMTKDTYTVKRTSGEMEVGWSMGAGCGSPDWVTQNAFQRTSGEWRIYMTNGKNDINTVVQGWRPLRDVYPTRLEGDLEGIKVWRKGIREILENLEEVRLEIAAKETSSAPPPVEEEPKKDPYDHKVETCSCGICETARYHRDTWNSSK
jgi:hypothetical protein